MEVGWVVFSSNQEPTLPLNPGKEPLDDLVPLVAAQTATVLDLAACEFGFVRRDCLCALIAHQLIGRSAVVRTISNQFPWHRCDHVEVERQLHQRGFVMIRRLRRHHPWPRITWRQCSIPTRRSRLARAGYWSAPSAHCKSLRTDTTAESGGARSSSSDRTVEACATARRNRFAAGPVVRTTLLRKAPPDQPPLPFVSQLRRTPIPPLSCAAQTV